MDAMVNAGGGCNRPDQRGGAKRLPGSIGREASLEAGFDKRGYAASVS